jgi:hypothetical protein
MLVLLCEDGLRQRIATIATTSPLSVSSAKILAKCMVAGSIATLKRASWLHVPSEQFVPPMQFTPTWLG